MSADQTADPLNVPLPADVRCGSIVFRKGVSLRIFVDAATRWKVLADEHVQSQFPPLSAKRLSELFQGIGETDNG